MQTFKKILVLLICINLLFLFFLIKNKNNVIAKKPAFGTVFNNLLKDETILTYNFPQKNIFFAQNKSTIFNTIFLEKENFKHNIDITNKLLKNSYNINVVYVIAYKNYDKINFETFILENKLVNPVIIIPEEVIKEKLSIFENSILISDLNIDKVVLLKKSKMTYENTTKNLENLYKKTKFVKRIQENKKINFSDTLLINSISQLLFIENFNSFKQLFILDKINKTIFGSFIDGKLNYKIDAKDVNNRFSLHFENIKNIKYFNNNIYILDDNKIKILDFKKNEARIFLENKNLEDSLDFDFISNDNLLISSENGKLLNYKNGKFEKINKQFGKIYKIQNYKNKIYFLDSTNLKFYVFDNSTINLVYNLKDLLNNKNLIIEKFAINNNNFYFLNETDNKIFIVSGNNYKTKETNINEKINDIAIFENNLYLANTLTIKKLNLIENDNFKDLNFDFSYVSKNNFGNSIYDYNININYNNVEKITLWNSGFINILLDNRYTILDDNPSYINLYKIEKDKLIFIKQENILSNEIVFDNIETSNKYYINGKIYYKENNNLIFEKNINIFLDFSDNNTNKNIRIIYSNLLSNKS